MAEDLIRYGELVERALRGVVRETLRRVVAEGLPGEHHFYITCRTGPGGLVLPPRLAARHPIEITVVMQNQFWDLEVGEDEFGVTLTFGGKAERLIIPYLAITAFFDPAVSFGLHFQPGAAAASGTQFSALATPTVPAPAAAPALPAPAAAPAAAGENVVKLDTFRKA